MKLYQLKCVILYYIIATVTETDQSALGTRSELTGGIIAVLSLVAVAAIVSLIVFCLYRRCCHTTKMLPNNADP